MLWLFDHDHTDQNTENKDGCNCDYQNNLLLGGMCLEENIVHQGNIKLKQPSYTGKITLGNLSPPLNKDSIFKTRSSNIKATGTIQNYPKIVENQTQYLYL